MSGIIYAQPFINVSPKIEFLFLNKASLKGTEVHGMYYSNSIESQHFTEKMERYNKKETVADSVSTLKEMVDRQEEDEVIAIYGSGPYHLSTQYAKFQMDSVKWHSLDAKKRRKNASLFQQHNPAMAQEFKKAQKSGKRANEKQI